MVRTRCLLIWMGCVLLAVALIIGLWMAAGPNGHASLQWSPLTTDVLAAAMWVCGTGGGALAVWLLVRATGGWPRWLAWLLRVLLTAAGGIGELLLSLALLLSSAPSSGNVTAMRIGGGCFYEIDDGFPDPEYTYHPAHGHFLMGRGGVFTGETRASDGRFPSGVSSSDLSRIDAGSTGCPAAGDRAGARPSAPSTPPDPVDRSLIAAKGRAGKWSFGLETTGAELGMRAQYTAIASSDGGRTWWERGTVPGDQGEYSYSVVSQKVQFVGLGTASDSAVPPILMTGDGGWTWHSVHLRVPAGTPPAAQFLDSAHEGDGGIVVTLNYPSWTRDRGIGMSFISRDGGRAWARSR